MTRPHRSVSKGGWAALRGAWPTVAAAKLPAHVNTLVVDGEVQDLAGVLDLPELQSLELQRWARPLAPLAGHPTLLSLNVAATGDFGSPAVFADLPVLERLFVGVALEDATRIPALMDQIPWSRLHQLRDFSIGATDWENEPLATHDLGFLSELLRIEYAAPRGSLLADPERDLTRERLPASLRELELIERELGELDGAAARLTGGGLVVMAVDIADEAPGLPWPPPLRGDLDDDAIEDLIEEAVTLEETEDGWTLSVLGSGLPIESTTSELRGRLLARVKPTRDIVIDIEGSELTILGRDLAVGEQWEEIVIVIMKELWGL